MSIIGECKSPHISSPMISHCTGEFSRLIQCEFKKINIYLFNPYSRATPIRLYLN